MVGSCDLLVVYGLLFCAFVIWVLVDWLFALVLGFGLCIRVLVFSGMFMLVAVWVGLLVFYSW